jgi:nitrate reductase gamma subunit
MDGWLAFAKGPLFTLTFLFMLMGLARHVLLQAQLLATKGKTLRRVRWRMVFMDTLGWVLPYEHLVRGTLLLTAVSILFHVGVLVVPLFLGGHVALWEEFLGLQLPSIGAEVADFLTLSTIVCLLVLFSYRLLIPRARELSRPTDYSILVVVLTPFLTGFLTSHPAWSPLPWNTMLLVHILSAEVLFVSIPFSKLSHMVLFPFDRLSQVHWQLRPGAGDRIAAALYGDEARV